MWLRKPGELPVALDFLTATLSLTFFSCCANRRVAPARSPRARLVSPQCWSTRFSTAIAGVTTPNRATISLSGSGN
eukprot:5724671-Pyramimonas_sp.AAC.1